MAVKFRKVCSFIVTINTFREIEGSFYVIVEVANNIFTSLNLKIHCNNK